MVDYDNLKDELLSVTDTGLKYGKSLDADTEYEVFVYYANSAEAQIDQGVVTAKDGAVAGNAVRAVKGKQISFACASGFSTERVKLSIEEALSILRSVKTEDARFKSLIDPKPAAKEGVFNKEILELGVDDLIKSSENMIRDAAAVDERAKIISASASSSWGCYAVGNSRGVLEASRFGSNGCDCSVQAQAGEERRSGYHFDVARDRVYSTEGIGEKAANDAISLLGATKLDFTGKLPSLWTPISAATYVLASLGQSVLGQPVVDKVSPLCDMMGDTIGPKTLTLVDDGQKPTGLGTNAIDGEGSPQRQNKIIEDGVLKSFLFNSYFGGAFGVESTGNCDRGGGVFGGSVPYENSPGVSTKWLEISAGSKTEEELISEVDGRGILIRDFPLGIFHTSIATGEFSVVASSAFLIESGELKHPIQPVSVAGHFYEGLKSLRGIGSNVEPLPYGIALPSLLFDDFSVTG
jgi:PmbA protein